MAQYVDRKGRKGRKGRVPTDDEKDRMREAIKRDDTATIQKMIEIDGVDINANISSEVGFTEYTKFALKRLTLPHLTLTWHNTAAHYAVQKNKLQSLQTIVQLGADITITDCVEVEEREHKRRKKIRKTPLERAVEGNKLSIVYYLYKDCHADISKLNKEYQDKVTALVQQYEIQEKIEKLAFDLALRDGMAKAVAIKVLLFGAENSGKTSVSATLVGDPFQDSSATEGADLEICNTSNWEKVTIEEASLRIQNEFLRNLKVCAESKARTAESKVLESERIRSGERISKHRSERNIRRPLVEASPKVDVKEIQEAKAAASRNVAKTGIDVTLLDFAGQLMYHNTHSVFIRKDNVVMVVFNAAVPLSQNVDVRLSTLRSTPMTNSQNFHLWLKMVHSVCHEPGGDSDKSSLLPVILPVATHLDLLGDAAEETKEQIIQTVAKELEGKLYAQHLAGHKEGLMNALRKYCIFLSNKDRDPVAIGQLQDAVVEVSSPVLSKEHPLVYLKIESALLNIKKGVITTKEFHSVAYSCGFLSVINSEEFRGALKHFHNRGVVLHFASTDSLKELVIISPHWLAKFLSYALIAQPYQRIGGRHDHAFEFLTQRGILLGSFLTYMLGLFNKSESILGCAMEQNQAVDLLKEFGFVAQISGKTNFLSSEVQIADEKEVYIVPSLLPESSPSLMQTAEKPDCITRVVHFYFPDRFVPPMLFNQMVAMCINRNEDQGEDIIRLKEGKVKLALGRGHYCVSLCEEEHIVQLSFALVPASATKRVKLLKYFENKLHLIMDGFMKASRKPVAYIPCCYCKELHAKLQLLFDGKCQHCPNTEQPIPEEHYFDLINDQAQVYPTQPNKSRLIEVITGSADVPDSSTIPQLTSVKVSSNKANCAAVVRSIRHNYVKLTIQPISAIIGRLFGRGVITFDEKKQLDAHPLDKDKTEFLLDNIITPSLASGVIVKYKGFLDVMKGSGDPTLLDMAQCLETETVTPELTSVDASAKMISMAKDKVRSLYTELTNLPINAMVNHLYAMEVITLEEKQIMKTKYLEREKMEFLLDSIIIPSLANNVGVKYRGLLEVMEKSGNPTLTNMAKRLGGPDVI